MARQNNILPKGAGPHLRSPLDAHAPRDPSATGQGYHGDYQQSYDPAYDAGHYDPARGEQHPLPPASPRDIFNTLRPDTSLASRLEPLSSGGRGHAQGGHHPQGGHAQDGYGRSGYEPANQGYTHGGHDAYGRPAPGGYEPALPPDPRYQDPRYYADPASDPMPRYQQGYAPQHGHGRDDAYAYDDPYNQHGADPYAASPELQPGQGAEGEYYGDDYVEEPEPRRGPRAVVVVGALIGAIVLGGGLAYGYKSIANGGRDSGKLPILRADSAPTKAQPTEIGGKQVAHTDKKLLNRLTEDKSPPRAGPGPVPVSILPPAPERELSASEGGPRRVPTMIVNRDGTISPSGAVTAAPPPPVSGVPGMLVEGLTPRMPPAPLRESPQLAPQRSIAAEQTAPPQPPRRVASAPPVIASEPPASAAPPIDAESKRRLPTATRQAARPPTPAPTGAGYVAVISSQQSRMDALKSFADIQQKYGNVLQGRTPDVREANLGEKGVWFRVVVGPPGSRESANSVCSQLKTQGYGSCWVMAY